MFGAIPGGREAGPPVEAEVWRSWNFTFLTTLPGFVVLGSTNHGREVKKIKKSEIKVKKCWREVKKVKINGFRTLAGGPATGPPVEGEGRRSWNFTFFTTLPWFVVLGSTNHGREVKKVKKMK